MVTCGDIHGRDRERPTGSSMMTERSVDLEFGLHGVSYIPGT
jgi:hypothetical protein